MLKPNRNDPCPCGSGKKFKKCHMGREEELVIERLGGQLPDDTAERIAALPAVSYGRSEEMLSSLNLKKITGMDVSIKFVDLGSYLELGLIPKDPPKDLDSMSAGQMINPFKTLTVDPDTIYLAITPAVSDSTLIHTLAHALDYLAGSKINPGLAGPLSMELELPSELLEHPREFGEWLDFLKNEFSVTLDAEDAIVDFLHEKGRLIPSQLIHSENTTMLEATVKTTIDFIREHRNEIDERIRNRDGYLEDQ